MMEEKEQALNGQALNALMENEKKGKIKSIPVIQK